MTRRSRAREVALQLLFQKDQNKVPVPRAAVEEFVRGRVPEPELTAFALALYDGVMTHQAEIDKLVQATAENWRLVRMMPADRNVLRMGAYELLHDPEPSPTAAVLNEAIELARRFGTADSPGFVNGILDKIAKTRAAEPTSPPA
jgi:N utilization substance protein B